MIPGIVITELAMIIGAHRANPVIVTDFKTINGYKCVIILPLVLVIKSDAVFVIFISVFVIFARLYYYLKQWGRKFSQIYIRSMDLCPSHQ